MAGIKPWTAMLRALPSAYGAPTPLLHHTTPRTEYFLMRDLDDELVDSILTETD